MRRTLVVVGIGGLVATAALVLATKEGAGVPLSELAEGVSAVHVEGTPVFVVRDDDRFTVFLTDVHHLEGERSLWWCPKERLFAAPTHGELFDEYGHVVGGPAEAGLDRLDARLDGNRLRIFTDRVTLGRKQADTDRRMATDNAPWDSGRSSFCSGALRL